MGPVINGNNKQTETHETTSQQTEDYTHTGYKRQGSSKKSQKNTNGIRYDKIKQDKIR